MTVRPTQTGQPNTTGLSRTGKANTQPNATTRPAATPQPAAPASPGDALQISSEARSLQQGGASNSANELGPDRLREIVRRMNDGHYDKPEVMDEVLRRMSRDL